MNIMFGLFGNKQGKMITDEAVRTMFNADENLNIIKKQVIARNVSNKIFACIKETENLTIPSKELDILIKKQVNEATSNRQNAITIDGENNPKWVEAALIESYLQANSGTFGKQTAQEVCPMIINWCKENMTQKDAEQLEKKIEES